jgi:hypothetical protein
MASFSPDFFFDQSVEDLMNQDLWTLDDIERFTTQMSLTEPVVEPDVDSLLDEYDEVEGESGIPDLDEYLDQFDWFHEMGPIHDV